MEWMRSSNKTAWEVDLDSSVPFYGVDRSFRKEFLSSMGTAQNLEQDGNSRRLVNGSIDAEQERILVESKIKIEDIISSTGLRLSRNGDLGGWMQLRLNERNWSCPLAGFRLRNRCTLIPEDRRIDAVCKGCVEVSLS